MGIDADVAVLGDEKIQDAVADVSDAGRQRVAQGEVLREAARVLHGPARHAVLSGISLKAMQEGSFLPQPDSGECPDETIPDRLRCEGSYVWCVPMLEPHRHNQP